MSVLQQSKRGGGGDSITIEKSDIVSEKSCCQGYKEDFRDGVAECANKCQKPHQKLKPNECLYRITHMSKELLAECVDTSCLAQEDCDKYLPKNKEVAVNVLNVLDGIHYRFHKELHFNLNKQDFHNKTTPPDLVDKGDDETSKHVDFDVVINTEMYNSGVSMLGNVKNWVCRNAEINS